MGCMMPRWQICGLAALAMLAVSPPGHPETGDPVRGEAIYGRCMACHALAYNRTGPRHCGLFGRRAGSLPDFNYSDAMRHSGIIWDTATLDRFLTSPTTVVTGTYMGYAGVTDAQERADLISWLKQATSSRANCP